MDVNVSPSILKSRVIHVLLVTATWKSTSYGCKCVTLIIKEHGNPSVVVRTTWESTSYGCKCVTLNIKE